MYVSFKEKLVELGYVSAVSSDHWLEIDRWMNCDFTTFSTVFQSYQDDGRLIMKGYVQRNSVYGLEDFASSEDRTWSARIVGQSLTH